MIAVYALAGVALLYVLDRLWSIVKRPQPVLTLVPKTGYTVDGKGNKTQDEPVLRHQITNLRWKINS